MESRELIEVYTDRDDTSTYHEGYVMACNEDYCAMALVSPQGRFDGYILERIDRIYSVQAGGPYEKKIQTLMKYCNTRINYIELDDSNLIFSFLDYARSTGSIVSLDVFGSDAENGIGFVYTVDHEMCFLKQVDLYGMNYNESYFMLEDISRISMNGEDETVLEILHTENYK